MQQWWLAVSSARDRKCCLSAVLYSLMSFECLLVKQFRQPCCLLVDNCRCWCFLLIFAWISFLFTQALLARALFNIFTKNVKHCPPRLCAPGEHDDAIAIENYKAAVQPAADWQSINRLKNRHSLQVALSAGDAGGSNVSRTWSMIMTHSEEQAEQAMRCKQIVNHGRAGCFCCYCYLPTAVCQKYFLSDAVTPPRPLFAAMLQLSRIHAHQTTYVTTLLHSNHRVYLNICPRIECERPIFDKSHHLNFAASFREGISIVNQL